MTPLHKHGPSESHLPQLHFSLHIAAVMQPPQQLSNPVIPYVLQQGQKCLLGSFIYSQDFSRLMHLVPLGHMTSYHTEDCHPEITPPDTPSDDSILVTQPTSHQDAHHTPRRKAWLHQDPLCHGCPPLGSSALLAWFIVHSQGHAIIPPKSCPFLCCDPVWVASVLCDTVSGEM